MGIKATVPRETGPLIAIGALYLLAVSFLSFVIDDAFISFRYARNLVEGHGLRYNLGPHVPVEGYSNFLWVMLCALFEALHLDITVWPLVVSTACGLALLFSLFFRLRSLSVGLLPTSLAVGGLAVFPPFAAWSTGGLETMPFCLLLWLTFDRLVLRPEAPDVVGGGVAALLLALVRIEGVFWAVLVLGTAIASRWAAREAEPRRFVTAVLILGAGYLVYSVWRISHFHEILPNTVYAKAAFSPGMFLRGTTYVASYVLQYVAPLTILPAAIAAIRSRPRAVVWPVVLLALAVPSYAVAVTGDWMPFGRLLVAGASFQTVLLAWALDSVSRAARPAVTIAVAFVTASLSALPAFGVSVAPRVVLDRLALTSWPMNEAERIEQLVVLLDKRTHRAKVLRRYAAELESKFGAEVSMVSGAVGVLGYYSRLYLHDRFGLVSPKPAHETVTPGREWMPGHDKWRPRTYFLDVRPTILWASVRPDSDKVAIQEMAEDGMLMYRNSDAATLYAPDLAVVSDPELGEHVVAAWILVPVGETPEGMTRRFHEELAGLGIELRELTTTREKLRALRKQ